MSTTLRVLRTTELRTASAPVAMAGWRNGLVVAASDLGAQAAALWLLEDGRVAGMSGLPLSQVAELIAVDGRLIISGSSATGQPRVLVDYSPISTGRSIAPETRGEIVHDPRCILTSHGAVIVWEEYLEQGTALMAQQLRGAGDDWPLTRPAVRGPVRPFAGSWRTVWARDGLVDVRIDQDGSVVAGLLDQGLAVHTKLHVADDRRQVAAVGGDRVVVAHSGPPGQPVIVQELDFERAEATKPIAVPIDQERASVGALQLATLGDGPLVALVSVETTLEDPEVVDLGRGPELRHPVRRTVEHCIIVDLGSGRLSNSIRLDPSSHAGAALVCSSDRVALVHGSSPLYLTELAVEVGS